MALASGLSCGRRSQNATIDAATQIYLADTMGELGLFYRLCPIVVIGGSFVSIGGHNPIEPAQLGAALIFGPHMHNFSEVTREFLLNEAAVQLKHSNEITFAVDALLASIDERTRRGQNARMLADQKRYILDQIIVEMDPWLKV